MLYLLDLTFRLAQWMNVSIITGSLVAKDVLALQLNFTSVRARLSLIHKQFHLLACWQEGLDDQQHDS